MMSEFRRSLTGALIAGAVIGLSISPAGGVTTVANETGGSPMAPAPGPLCPPAEVEEGLPCYSNRQWNIKAIGAEQAWAAGHFGSPDVRIAILDTGIDYLHPDLAGRVDLDAVTGSTSLLRLSKDCTAADPGAPTPRDPGQTEEDWAVRDGRAAFQDYHSHGTAVAGLVASNGEYLAGVTRDSTLIAIKVHDRGRDNCLSVYLAGIYAAVERGADVIHLSVPLEWDPSAYPGSVARVNEATKFAHKSGAVLVAAAGNSAEDIDGDRNRFRFCNADYVFCVSATGPNGPTEPLAARNNGPWTDWDRPADYTNVGRATIDVAGPGGSGIPQGAGMVTARVPVWLICSQLAVPRPDGRPCTEPANPLPRDRVIWSSVGTSFGAAATSGLAALLVSILGPGHPDEVEAIIRESAEDVADVPDSEFDRPGRDKYYGWGRIDVAAAVAIALEQD